MKEMLNKGPYLDSLNKPNEIRQPSYLPQQPSYPPQQPSYLPQHNTSTQSQPVRPHADLMRNRAVSSGEANELKGRVKVYERELKNME
jgi:hypothetical protein